MSSFSSEFHAAMRGGGTKRKDGPDDFARSFRSAFQSGDASLREYTAPARRTAGSDSPPTYRDGLTELARRDAAKAVAERDAKRYSDPLTGMAREAAARAEPSGASAGARSGFTHSSGKLDDAPTYGIGKVPPGTPGGGGRGYSTVADLDPATATPGDYLAAIARDRQNAYSRFANSRIGNTLAGGINTGNAGYVNAAGTLIDFAHRNAAYNVNPEDWASLYEESKAAPELGVVTKLHDTADTMQGRGAQQIETAKDGLGWFGQRLVDAGVSGTQMLGDAAINALLPGAGLAALGARSFGSTAMDARHEGANVDQQMRYGLANAAVEVLSEKIGDIPGVYGGGWLDDAVKSLVGKIKGYPALSGLAETAAAALGESLEEFAAGIIEPGLKSIYNGTGYFDNKIDWGEVRDAMAVGGLLGGMGGVAATVRGSSDVTENAVTNTAEAPSRRAEDAAPYGEESGNAAPEGTAEAVQAGKVTTIQHPYQGKAPVQEGYGERIITVPSASVSSAWDMIDQAQNTAAQTGKGFKTALTRLYQQVFRRSSGVPVTGMTYDGQPYLVEIGNKVPGKVISDPNLSAEKLALLDVLPEVVQNAQYVGSGEYAPNKKGPHSAIRYDYFETPVQIEEQNYIAKFDVEVVPGANNYRTHQIVNVDLTTSEASLVGPTPTASPDGTGPQGRGDAAEAATSTISTIAQPKPIVNREPETFSETVMQQTADKETPAQAQNKPAARAEHPGLVRDEKTDAAGLTHRQERALDVLGKVLGVEVRFADALTDVRGRKAQARYADGVITLALDAADPFMATAVHETVHRIRELSEGDYDYLKSFVIDNMSSHNYSDDQSAKARLYGENADLTEETVADAFGRILGDEATLRQFVKENSTAAQRFFDALNDLLDRVRAALRGESVETRTLTPEQRAVYSDLAGKLDTMLKLYGDALGNVRESAGEANGGAKYSIKNTRNMSFEEQMDRYFANNRTLKSSDSLYLGTSGDFLESKGIKNAPRFIPTGVITKAMREVSGSRSAHGMTENDIRNVEKGIQKPAAIVYNPSRNAIVYLTGQESETGGYVVVSFDLNNDLNGETAHKATSIHKRDSVSGLLNNLGEDSAVYVFDKNKLNQMLPGEGIYSSKLLAKVEFVDDYNTSFGKSKQNNPMSDREAFSQLKAQDADYAAVQPPSFYDMAYAMYTGESDQLYRQLSGQQNARGGPMPPAPGMPDMARDDSGPMNADPRSDGQAEPELPVDYLSILDLGYGPVSASKLRDLLTMGEVETYVEDGKIRFRRVNRTE